MKHIIGIDPGAKGGIAALDMKGNLVTYEPFKTLKSGEPDWDWNLNILISFLEMDDGVNDVWLEDLHALGLVKSSTNFKLGRFVGWVHGVCSVWTDVNWVKPKAWQKKVWSGEDLVMESDRKKDVKATSLACAQRLFPDEDFIPKDCKRCRTAHDGIVDSILIAYYGYLKQK